MNQEVPDNANTNCPGILSEQAGEGSNCEGCPNQALCSSGTLQIDPSIPIINSKLSSIKRIIFVLSGKGGVGKSTVATQLAVLLSKDHEVGLLDVDICGPSVPTLLGLVGQEVHQSAEGWSPVYWEDLAVMSIGFLLGKQDDAVIWRGPRKNGLIKQFLQQVNWGELDYLIIDTPPGTSDEHLSLLQYIKCRPSDGAIVVTTPQEVALADVRKQLSFCKKTELPIIGVVENMSGFACPHCKCQSELFVGTSGGVGKMCKDFNCELLCRIPIDPKMQSLLDQGKPMLEGESDSPALQQYLTLKKIVEGRVKGE